MSKNTLVGLSCVALLVGGCATGTGRPAEVTTTPLQGGEVAIGTTADTRLVFSSPNTSDNTFRRTANITCAEPSPDIAKIASEAFSASVSAGADAPIFDGRQGEASVAGALGNSRAEHVAELGRRLATVQLVRDSLFRACEAYANGAIDETMYAIAISRFDDVMVALFATEMAQGGDSPEAIIITDANAFAPARARQVDAAAPSEDEGSPSLSAQQMDASAAAGAAGANERGRMNATSSQGGATAVASIANTYLTNSNLDAAVVACIAELGRQPRDREMYIEPQGSRWANNLLSACLHPTDGILARVAAMERQNSAARLEIERLRAETELERVRRSGVNE